MVHQTPQCSPLLPLYLPPTLRPPRALPNLPSNPPEPPHPSPPYAPPAFSNILLPRPPPPPAPSSHPRAPPIPPPTPQAHQPSPLPSLPSPPAQPSPPPPPPSSPRRLQGWGGQCLAIHESDGSLSSSCIRGPQVAACPWPEPPAGPRRRTEEEALRRRIEGARTPSHEQAGPAGAALLWIHVHLQDPTSVAHLWHVFAP